MYTGQTCGKVGLKKRVRKVQIELVTVGDWTGSEC